jgi:thiol:disulfide interchange protein DsbD
LREFTVVASTGGYRSVDDFLTFIRNAENGVKEEGWFEGRGPLAILLLVFFGGLALNLTPCVLPMIPINLAIIGAGAKAGSRSRGFVLGGVYGAAMALVYGLLGVVVIQVVLFSSDLYAQGTVAALALPFLLGIGMAVPWPIAGAGLTALPKPGAWMVRVKQAFGVFILATAAYYGYLAYGLFADRWVDAKEVASSVEEKLKAGWHASLAEGLDVAMREQKPVLLDMWATWCKNCVVMDRTTLADPAVTKALEGYVKIKYQAEQLDEQPARTVVERVKAVGLPTYAILRPQVTFSPQPNASAK